MRQYLKLARIGNVAIAFISVECAGILCGVDVVRSWQILVTAIAASLVTAGGNAINDYFDVDIDRINRPGRPLASGSLSKRSVRVFYSLVTLGGLTASAAVNELTFIIAVGAAILVLLYSAKLKRTVFFGNFVVALVTGLAFIFGGAAVRNFSDVYPAAIFAFLTNLIREIIKDAEDVKGDSETGIRTIATRYGTKTAEWLSLALTGVLLYIVWEAYRLSVLPVQFLAVCGLTILPISVYVSYLLVTRQDFSEASFGYKLIMIFGLVALVVGKV